MATSPKDLAKGDARGYYAILGVHPSDDASVIKRAFHHQSTLFHTDKHAGRVAEERDAMNRRFQLLNEAYQVLGDPRRRAAYDHSGSAGVERLALIPESVQVGKQLQSVLDALEVEAEAKRIAKAVSASGKVTTSLDLTPLTQPNRTAPAAARRPAAKVLRTEPPLPKPSPQEPASAAAQQRGGVGGDHAAGPVEASPSLAADKTATTEGLGPPVATTPTPPPPGHPGGPSVAADGSGASQVAVTVKRVVLDGKETFIFVPAESVQRMLAQQFGMGPVGGGGGLPAGSGLLIGVGGGGGGSLGFLWRAAALYGRFVKSSAPYSIALRQVWEIPLSNASYKFSVAAALEQTRKASEAKVTLALHIARSTFEDVECAVRFTLSRLLARVSHNRVLNAVWTLRNSLDVLDGTTLLPRYTLELVRRLSPTVTLANSVTWVMQQGGSYTCVLHRRPPQAGTAGGAEKNTDGKAERQGTETGEASLSVVISPGSLMIGATQQTILPPWGFAPGTAEEEEEADEDAEENDANPGEVVKKKIPRRFTVSHQVQFNPITGRTSVGYDAWFPLASYQKLGFGLSTTLPFSVNPFSPSTHFLCWAPNSVCLTQLNLMYRQHSYVISFPLTIWISPAISHAVLLLGVPLLCLRFARVIATPVWKAQAARRNMKVRMENRATILAARETALTEQRAMQSVVETRKAAEEAVQGGGLIVINARYGVLVPLLHGGNEEDVPLDIDVTIAVQALVRESQLRLPITTKSILAGFYDPDPYAPRASKSLRVSYWFHGVRHFVEARDDEALLLPQRTHIVQQEK